MTIEDIKDLAEDISEESFSDSMFLSRINSAKDEINAEQDWEFLKEVQEYTVPSSYKTTQDLPTDFDEVIKIVEDNGIYEYRPIPYEKRDLYKDSTYNYYIDYADDKIGFANGNSETAKMYYKKLESDYSATTETPIMPKRFHKLLAYKFLVDWFIGEDVDDINKQKAQLWGNKYDDLMGKMIDWDAEIKSATARRQGYTSKEYLISKGINHD